jgi:PAS domain S-box-containing protein
MVASNDDLSGAPRGIARISGIVPMLAFVAVAAAFFGLVGWLGITLTRGEGRIAAVWIPNAIALVALLNARRSQRLPLLAAMIAGFIGANLAVGDDLVRALGLSTANGIEVGVALWLIERLCGKRPDMRRLRDLGSYVLCAGLVAPMVAATFAAVALGEFHEISLAAWAEWTLADGLGMIIVGPALLIIVDVLKQPRWPTRREVIEWGLLTACGTAITIAVFAQGSYPFLFLVAPVVLAYAFRLGALGTAFALIKIGVVATWLTLHGTGPISLVDGSMAETLFVLQVFLASVFVTGLPVAAALDGQARIVRELADKQSQLSLLTENVTDAVLVFDGNGVCRYASPSVADVLDRDPAEMVGKRPSQRTHSEAFGRIAEAERKLVNGEIEQDRFTYRRLLDDDGGKAVFIEADCALVRKADGEPDGIIVSARDVTERVSLEKQLDRARRLAENAAAAKSQFLANMSHEIRTPMNGVLGFAQLLQQGELEGEQRRHVDLIAESGEVMMRLLNDILDISKIEAGQMAVVEEPVRVHDLLESCRKLHWANAQRKGVGLTLEIDDDIPECLLSDAMRLRQIVLNLVGNAVKFTNIGEVTIKASHKGNAFEVAVQDSGVGIAPERIEAIFNPFEQADGATSRRFGGSGLGLTISRQLAELMGGELSADSEIGMGSRFILRLPFRAVEQDAEIHEPLAAEPPPMPPRARILLAEDNDINRMLVTAMLERCGQQVEIAEDGGVAARMVEAAAHAGRAYDLVLMDVQMPHCDGYEATRRIRRAGFSADKLPIVALTANAYEDDVKEAWEAGMQSHLAKPLAFKDLVATLHRWLPAPEAQASDASGRSDREAAPVQDNAGVSHATPASDAPAKNHYAELQARWQERRAEAIAAVTRLLREVDLTPEELEEIGSLMHKLAGTAAMFDEAALGEAARDLENSIRRNGDVLTMRETAERVIRAA